MNHGRNAFLRQCILNRVTLLDPNCKLRPDAFILSRYHRQPAIRAVAKSAQITLSHNLSCRDLVIQYRKLRQQDRRLKGVKPAVHADANVMIAPVLPMPRDLADIFANSGSDVKTAPPSP